MATEQELMEKLAHSEQPPETLKTTDVVAPEPKPEVEPVEIPEPEEPIPEMPAPVGEVPEPIKKKTPYQRRIDQLTAKVKFLEGQVYQPVAPGQPMPMPIPVQSQVPMPGTTPQTEPYPIPKPIRESFNMDEDAFQEAVIDWKTSQREWQRMKIVQVRNQEQEIATVKHNISTKMEEGFEMYGPEKFNEISHNLGLVVPPTIKAALFKSDVFPELVVKLGTNLAEARRISELDPMEQIYEIKTLEKSIKKERTDISKKVLPVPKAEPNKVETPGVSTQERTEEATIIRNMQEAKKKGDLTTFFQLREQLGVDRR